MFTGLTATMLMAPTWPGLSGPACLPNRRATAYHWLVRCIIAGHIHEFNAIKRVAPV
jgi:hypothetical protein